MDIVVIGTGGLAREFTSFFSDEVNIVGFSSDTRDEYERFSLQGEFFGRFITAETVGTKYAVVAIGNPKVKRAVGKELKDLGFKFPNLIHSSVVSGTILDDMETEGVIISPNSVIGSNVNFSNHIFINFMVGIGHDVILESFVQVNPGAQIGGGSFIKSGVTVGSGSVVRQGLTIETGSVVGSGAVVLSTVAEGITVLGNPAKRLRLPVASD
ncbi:hypothetical protein N9A13_02235 [Alphaproteobacteria bacterium]|nr:hypothetical protein [Alphaproteobacteria bacterium]